MPNTIVADPNDACGFLAVSIEASDTLIEDEQAVVDAALRAIKHRLIESDLVGDIAYLTKIKEFLRNTDWAPADTEPRRKRINELERDWSAKQADIHLQLALKAAFEEDRANALALITKAKPFITKAVSLEIGDRFADIAARKVNVVEFTLGVKETENNQLKPKDYAPRPLDLAKSERRGENRFREPPLLAYFDGEVLATDDYSMGGLAMSGYHGALDLGDKTTMSFGRTKADLVSVEVEVRRRDRDLTIICVQFFNAKTDVYNYIAAIIRAQRALKRQ